MTLALDFTGVGKRFGTRWALRDCSIQLEEGRIAALIGPNGAGKSTLLQLAVGLLTPTEGDVRVFGRSPESEISAVLPLIGYVAQDRPLFLAFSVDETLTLGRRLNPAWDDGLAAERLSQLGISGKDKVTNLSGGQRAQVSLVLALAKRPRILLLDEPVAAFDPLARRDFWRVVLESAAETGITVLVSSHIVNEIEQVCDHVLLLSDSKLVLQGEIDDLLEEHRLLVGPVNTAPQPGSGDQTVWARSTERQTSMLVRGRPTAIRSGWVSQSVSLEDIVMAYLEKSKSKEAAEEVPA